MLRSLDRSLFKSSVTGASQVRRLSERGEGSGPGPRQTEFLATLSTAPAPVPGGRRHSVVTISKVPSALFGRDRRGSVAAFTSAAALGRILSGRRESVTSGPPSTEPRGSVHNLQLDIMDDIVQARKVRMKLWNARGEKVCEVQPLDEAAGVVPATSVQRYAASGRRYSDFVGTTLAPIPSASGRRASEFPRPASIRRATTRSPRPNSGIICTDTDLISMLSSLTSSATEINRYDSDMPMPRPDQLRDRLKNARSNSFDVSLLSADGDVAVPPAANWFVRRHQPMSRKTDQQNTGHRSENDAPDATKPANKVLWDGRSGSVVDAALLGNAIEDFLRRSGGTEATPASALSSTSTAHPKLKSSGWFGEKGDSEPCDSSLCSTLKDLFVK